MGAAIAKLPGRKLILTNGSTDHAGKVLERLGIGAHFEAVFDIIAAELEPKPAPQTYQKFLDAITPSIRATSAMFEDLARNLVVPHQLGMTTVLVVPDGTREVVREDWELEGRDAAHVDHVTDDLTGFLQGLATATALRHAPRRRGPSTPRPLVDRLVETMRSQSRPGHASRRSQGRQAGVLDSPAPNPDKSLLAATNSSQGNLDVSRRPRIHHQRRVRRPRRHLDRDQGRGPRRRGSCARPARQGRGARGRARGQRQVEGQSVAEEGGAAVVPPQRHERDFRRPRQGLVVGQGAVEIRRLGREPLSRRRLSRRAGRDRPPLGLHRQERRPDAVLRQSRRLCR